MDYSPPIKEMSFIVKELLGLESVSVLPGYEEATSETFDLILAESARFTTQVLAPLNAKGDRHGAHLEGGDVKTPPGFKEAYEKFLEGGWNGLTAPQSFGGQGLPTLLAAPLEEMWHAANMAFTLGPLLTRGAVEAINYAGTDEQKSRYLPSLVSGQWMGTMNLTEPQAGSDLAALRTQAWPGPDGAYRIRGQKIFITYGNQDWTDNIIHLVLARLPDAPPGVRGLSLFIVPRQCQDASGAWTVPNEVTTVSLEHKLGIHGSPTCVLSYGEDQGAWGELLGKAHRGLELMFVMMNAARFSVGIQGVGIGDRAWQGALAYARTRIQGIPVGYEVAVPIIHHPDVQRLLVDSQARLFGARCLAYYGGKVLDEAQAHPDPALRARAQRRSDLLTPLVKGYCTELGVWLTSEALQVFGGMGYIEETGMAQYYRDGRIATIYEGTTGIQANDLVGRKLWRDRGEGVRELLDEIGVTLQEPGAVPVEELGAHLRTMLELAGHASETLLQLGATDPRRALAVSVPYLHLMATLVASWWLLRSVPLARAGTGGLGHDFYAHVENIVSFHSAPALERVRGWARQIDQPTVHLTAAAHYLSQLDLSNR
ncbi:MAG: acyl-CoA dehydrogenase [Betaproteobacteria bacterium]|jgi:Acyl-CoA dehydrogenases|nr:acyl-CoA dehydrogenase [Betaproteobacteria bacterium]